MDSGARAPTAEFERSRNRAVFARGHGFGVILFTRWYPEAKALDSLIKAIGKPYEPGD